MADVLLPLTEPWPADPPTPPLPSYSTGGYIAESFGAFFGDPTWWKKTLVGGLVTLVPLAGPIAVLGYSLTWARQTAWAIDRGLPETSDLGATFVVGWRGFVTRLAWALIGMLVLVPLLILAVAAGVGASMATASELIPVAVIGGMALGLLGLAALVFTGLMGTVGSLRATLYERIAAGTTLDGPLSLIRRHSVGFWSAFGVSVLVGLVPYALNIPSYVFSALAQSAPDRWVGVSAISSVVMLPVVGFATFMSQMISMRAYGRWLREIDPRTLPPLDMVTATVDQGADTPPPSNDPFSDAGDVAP